MPVNSSIKQALTALLSFILLTAASGEDSHLDGHKFGLLAIEKNCVVEKYSPQYGNLVCKESRLKPVERKCEALIDQRTNKTEITCRGAQLRPIEQKCKVEMVSADKGTINCRIG